MGRDLGDFPTPSALVELILDRLDRRGLRFRRALEPACGAGRFIKGLLARDTPPDEILGVEWQAAHARAARADFAGSSRVQILDANLFALDLRALSWADPTGELLVVGNPPWVTNSEMGALESALRPPRSNSRNARGIDAMTGGSNFDTAEAVWLKLLTELADQAPTVALLCKMAVARNVLAEASQTGLPLSAVEIIRVDARQWFGASVEACLLIVNVAGQRGDNAHPLPPIPVFSDFQAETSESRMGFASGRLVADLDGHQRFSWADGPCPLVWRQGIKHDAANVMELMPDEEGGLHNKLGESVRVEADSVFPLLKGTDLSRPSPVPRRGVLVTQRVTGDDTAKLANEAPVLWHYLTSHAEVFQRRKSSVYRGRASFAMFGIGPYAFAPFKVVVSGLHRVPCFHAIGPVEGRPVMVDDTCYLLPCSSAGQAAIVAAILNQPAPIGLLRSLALPGAKRAVTKAALQRIDLAAVLARADRTELLAQASTLLERLTDRQACWPGDLGALLEPWHSPLEDTVTWPSPRSTTTAVP